MDSFTLKDLLSAAAPRADTDHLQALLCGTTARPSLVPSVEAQVASNALLKELVLPAPPAPPASPPQKTNTIWQSLQSAAPPPNAEALVAKSLLSAKPSPFLPPGRMNPPLKQLQWDEEGHFAHWPVDDDAVFYRMSRMSPSAEALGRRGFFDLNIVMPILIPKAEIRVIDPDGENYYNLAESNPGAHLLFGRTSQPPPAAASGGTGGLQTDDENFAVKPPADVNSSGYPAVCDVWASFLNVQLGTIRNCRGDQVIEICQLFNYVFSTKEDDASSPYFLVPITIDCRGINPRTATGTHKSGTQERYETKGTLLTENDRNRFRIIRRKLKKFVLLLWQEFGVQSDINAPFKFDCALHDNCKTHNADGIRIEIRRYSPLTHPDLLKHIWKENARVAAASTTVDTASTVFELNELAPVSAQTRIVVNEVRLEMTHARMIDPRWTSQWVLARRMPATPPTSNAPPMFARHVFCSRVETPRVIYEFAHPRRALLDSRFAPLYLLAETSSRDSISAEEAKRKLRQAKQQMSAAAVPFFPLTGVLGKLAAASSPPTAPANEEGSGSPEASTPRVSAWDRLVTSATLAGLPDHPLDFLTQLMKTSPFEATKGSTPPAMRTKFSSPPRGGTPGYRSVPLTEEPCRFFQLGSCARGDHCYFLHPADPQMESVADVRHLSPSNPIFF